VKTLTPVCCRTSMSSHLRPASARVRAASRPACVFTVQRINVNLDCYLDKIERRDQAFKTLLAQLHMYL
jgi:hypothetical protein